MPSVLLDEIKQRLEQITSACGRIVHVAKVSQAPPLTHTPWPHSLHPPSREKPHSSRSCVHLFIIILVAVPSYCSSLIATMSKGLQVVIPSIYSPLTRTYSELVRVEEQLTSWSKYKYPRIMSKLWPPSHSPPLIGSQVKRKEVEGGVAGFVEKLSTIVSLL